MAIQIEQGMITELLASRNITTVVDNCITSNYFTGKYKRAFSFILDHQNQYGQIPTIETFQKKFKDIELATHKDVIGTGENIQYWCDEVRNKKKHNTIAENLDEVIDLLNEDKDTEGAYEVLKRTVLKVENELILSDRIKINENTNKRWEDYKKRQVSGGITGLPTGIDLFDKLTGGLNKGELTTFMAYTGVGKSWMQVIIAVEMAKAGYKVLFFTTEMSTNMVFRRIDAVWNKFNYSLFKKGQMHTKEEKQYQKYLEEMANKSDEEIMLIVEQATSGVSQISAKIDQYQPDVVLVDGGYLLADEEGEDDNWMSMVRIWRGLHRLCLSKNIPIVVSTQSKDESNANLKSVNFSKAIAQDTDIFFVLEQDEQDKNDKEAQIRFLKLREGDMLSIIRLNWDFDKMDYSCLFKEKIKEQKEVENVEGVINID